ncbi:putative ABC transporter ATP-binding protein YxlF [Corynebacterium felinum]|nr:putative ABC transporter ATP-binding protein YxlF [Corynebacterium felinum]
MITVEKISHTYGRGTRAVEALNNINATFSEGTTALLGPNGSGKSTLMNIIGTTIIPTHGHVLFNGKPVNSSTVEEYRTQLGVVPQHITLPKRMRLRDILSYLCWVHKIPRSRTPPHAIAEVLERLELSPKANARVGDLSGGQLRRAGFACALIHAPSVLILDEPTVGLDPEVRMEMRHLIAELATNTTILLSTHLLEDVRFLQPNVVMINRGQMVFTGSYNEFLAALPEDAGQQESSVEQAYQQMLRTSATEKNMNRG